MAAQPKNRKAEPDLNRLTTMISIGVFVVCLVVVGGSAWFIYDALNAVGSTGGQGNETRFRVETIDTSLLDTIEKRISDKTQAPEPNPAQLHNPFLIPPPPSAPPAAPAAETPPAPPAPETTPPAVPPAPAPAP